MFVILEIVSGLPVQVNHNYKQLSLLNFIISRNKFSFALKLQVDILKHAVNFLICNDTNYTNYEGNQRHVPHHNDAN